MDSNLIYEVIGYIASVLVALSLTMKNIVRLRVISLTGAATFMLYGILIAAWPVVVMNLFIILINIYHLYKIFSSNNDFELLKVSPEDNFLKHFIDTYRGDILNYQPNFKSLPDKGPLCFFILRNTLPAGLIMGKIDDNSVFHMDIDYVLEPYRDFKMGEYIYESGKDFLSGHGVKRIRTFAEKDVHIDYLKKMGFKEFGQNWFEREL